MAEGRLVYGGNRFETAVWTGSSLDALAEGATISSWPNALALSTSDVEKWNIAHNAAFHGCVSGTTPPTLKRDAVNGHHAVSFNGNNTCFLTGTASQPIGDKDAFTVAMVIQTEAGFVGNTSTNICEATQFFGASQNSSASSTARLYGLALDERGRLGCGTVSGLWLGRK